jgi:hypothetical protein
MRFRAPIGARRRSSAARASSWLGFVVDAGSVGAGSFDAGIFDAKVFDAKVFDSGVFDSGTVFPRASDAVDELAVVVAVLVALVVAVVEAVLVALVVAVGGFRSTDVRRFRTAVAVMALAELVALTGFAALAVVVAVTGRGLLEAAELAFAGWATPGVVVAELAFAG